MAYQIRYGQTMTMLPVREKQSKINVSSAIKWIGLTCVVLIVVFLAGAGYLDFLIPGNKEVTTAAFSTMVEEVQQGESVKDSLTTFCLEILNSAQIDG